jgi:hypothetical protein
MIHLSKRAQDGTASLMIGSDLRAAESNAEWRRLQLPDGKSGERIDKLFPGTDVGGYVLDVLASGVSSENVVIRMRADSETRYLCASFYPLPSAAKPRKVRMTVVEMKACLVSTRKPGQFWKPIRPRKPSSATLRACPTRRYGRPSPQPHEMDRTIWESSSIAVPTAAMWSWNRSSWQWKTRSKLSEATRFSWISVGVNGYGRASPGRARLQVVLYLGP